MTPQEIQQLYQDAEDRARKTGKLARVHAGVYICVIDGKAWTLSQLNENPGKPWIAETTHYHSTPDYTDSFPTLWQLKEAMGVAS